MLGIVTWIGGRFPWLARYDNGAPQLLGQPCETLRGAQRIIESSAVVPLRWRKIVDAENVTVNPETWVADTMATPAVVPGGKGPWIQNDGDVLVVSIAQPGISPTPVSIVLQASPAVAEADNAGDYAIVGNASWVVTVARPSGVENWVVSTPASPGTLDAAAAAVWLNANALPPGAGIVFTANVTNNTLSVESTVGGSGVSISATGNGTLAASLGFTTNVSSVGLGNVPDQSNITVADAYNMIAGAAYDVNPTVSAQGAIGLASKGVGLSYSLQVVLGSSTMTLDFDGSIHYGTGP